MKRIISKESAPRDRRRRVAAPEMKPTPAAGRSLSRKGTRRPNETAAEELRSARQSKDSSSQCLFSAALCSNDAHNRDCRFSKTLKALSDSNAAMARATKEAQLLNDVCRIIVNDCGHAMVWIGYAVEDRGRTVLPMAGAGLEKGYLESLKISWAETARGRGPTGTAIRTGRPCQCRNMLTDPAFKPWRALAVKHGYASSLVVPLLADGRAIGAVNIHSRLPDAFSEDEVRLLTDLANNLTHGITMLRLRAANAEAEAALRASEERYRALFCNMAEGFALCKIICDQHGVPKDYLFIETNSAFETQTGLGRENVIGRLVSEVLPNLEPYWIEMFGKVALTGKPARFENHVASLRKYFAVFAYSPAPLQFAVISMDITDQKLLEKRLRHAASFPHLNPNPVIEVDRGGRITYNNPASEKIAHRLKARDASVFLPADIGDILAIPQSEPLYREVEIAGQVFGETVSESLEFNTVRIFGTNITERKRAEIALRERTEELDRVVDAKNELIGVAAHDLRNPLFVLNAFCELLMRRRRSKNHQPILPFIETMRHQTNYMARLVDDLLDVSVIETGKLTLRSEPTDLADLLQRIVALQREVAAGKKISIHCRVSAPLPRVVIDRNKIEQVFNNLLINAIKFSPPASTITLDAEESGNRIVCAVRDQGGGIPRELLDQIFKPYFKGRRQGTAGEEGFGLGLAIARKIAAAHGGELVVKSKIGHGSTFMLILPLKDR